jgi:hypothetical protein
MGLIRDLWHDPDPLKWVIFGGFAVSLGFGGALYWQSTKLAESKDSIARLERKPPKAGEKAPTGSLQALADKAEQVKSYLKQVDDDPLTQAGGSTGDDPEMYASTYVYKQATPSKLPNPKTATTNKGGTGFSDTEISVTFPKETVVLRDNIWTFLYNMERSPQVVCTQCNFQTAVQGHKPGMTLPQPDADGKPSNDEIWTLDSRFTIRRPKTKPGTPAK